MATISDLTAPKTDTKKPRPLQIGPRHLSPDVSLDDAGLREGTWATLLPNLENEQLVLQILRWPFLLRDPEGLVISFVDDAGRPVAQDNTVVRENDEETGESQGDADDIILETHDGGAVIALANELIKPGTLKIDDAAPHVRGVVFATAELRDNVNHEQHGSHDVETDFSHDFDN